MHCLVSCKSSSYDTDNSLSFKELFEQKKHLEKEYLKLLEVNKELTRKLKVPEYTFPIYDTNRELITKYEFPQIPKLNDDTQYYELTITIDPAKHHHLIDYNAKRILWSALLSAYKKQLIKSVYGCFEYQSNGNIHTHCLISKGYSISPLSIKKHLSKFVTETSKYAVDLGYKTKRGQRNTLAPTPNDKISGWISYMNKPDTKKKSYYTIDQSLDLGLDI